MAEVLRVLTGATGITSALASADICPRTVIYNTVHRRGFVKLSVCHLAIVHVVYVSTDACHHAFAR